MAFPLAVILCLLLGAAFLWRARRVRVATGLPAGEVVYSDTGAWRKVEEPLISRRFGLVGKPDYVVEITEKGQRYTVPIEIKSRTRPEAPLAGHILQLGAYCLLVEDCLKQRPPYGLLRYADATVRIPFTAELQQQVIEAANAIRHARTSDDVHRQHADAWRCRGCGYRHVCGEEIGISP